MMRRLGTIVRKNKRYIWIGLALMLLGIFLGYTNAEAIKQAAKQMMDSIQRIAKHINDANNPLYTFWVIFENNVIAAFSMVGLGIFFLGLYPALGLITNGILLGFLLKVYANGGVNPLKIFLAGILPHGILELSAIIFASAIGIKLGVLTYDWIVSWFVKERRAGAKARFGEMLRDLPLIIGTIVVMLFLAAIIESTVTPLLIQNFMGQEMSVVKDMFK
ncbi:stage II sporulation protein M [Aneurinibacillus aneurinilyticus]|jgi:stage II sporulation protein M|uniref:Stage II sporulation protein M n=2 Tax=Aneurinibacillus aneurinilyticus TaxID=1391 RepID=A0A848D0P0_ANEAE|nr:stage II sporulation protein M [Aneurinibacillus aneurinilyticus]ERI06742.1 membrane protein [Aneurinibacillus aneurinilyticus ATCC 12856]MCI1695245.1 stage II sporulation protein M [Aneurinibacillus aneurinilyticus]MED0673323.1 stage II sporulation protein M [Aneurinibacillus aneurinilyticus]MED0707306.1 stage II sporulation protein M [Aneurinibacillus aneurinilyticus]MED0721647.1 stage II sporulation protein M [Aneurinibacillus aneurinilyticus]